MTASDQPLIGYFSAPVPRHGHGHLPERVKICHPADGANVPTDFQADGALQGTDTDLASCDVNKQPASSTTVTFPKWTASFTAVPVSATPVPLTAKGNNGGIDVVMITVGAPAPGVADPAPVLCIQMTPAGTSSEAALGQKQATSPEQRNMLRHLRVKRRDPAQPDGFALRLEFRGAAKANFIVGGKLSAPGDRIEKCFAGTYQADPIVHEGGEWQAAFTNVQPGDYVLTVETKAAVTDQARILIEATE
jgi:hypothetical protein